LASPILTPALTRLRSGFTRAYPGRGTASDGWIGDLAHQGGTSGHNPDDTPGVSAERSDADGIPEVRAIDVDVDLIPGDRARSRLATLQEIRRIIATPADRRRLIYIIFDGLIWSASRGWEPATYTGSNKHREHAHYSGHPDHDNDGRAWSVETGGTNVATREEVREDLARLLQALTFGTNSVFGPGAHPWMGQAGYVNLPELAELVRGATAEAAKATSEAALAKELAGQAGVAVGRVEEKVDQLLARPPVELDYRALAVNLLQVIQEQGAAPAEGG
jgi:hypothetical protein